MSIYDRFKNQPLMRMQDGGSPLTREQAAEILNMSKEGIPMFSGDGSFTTPSIDLGGGLGAIPGVTLNYNDILAGLKDQMFGIPTVFTDPVEDPVEEEEVVDEVETIAPVMPSAPVVDPVEEVVSDEVATEVVPSPTPSPTPAPPVVDTSGIGSLPQVVLPPAAAEDMNLITGTDAGLTDEEINSVVNPTLTPTTGNDLAKLNQQYNDTFLKFLVQNDEDAQAAAIAAQAAAQQNMPVYNASSPQGQQSGLQAGEYISRRAQTPNQQVANYGNSQGQYGIPNVSYQNTYSTPADVQFQMDNIFGGGYSNNIKNQNFTNPYQQYGNLMFPVFGSGVTSLVPQEAVNELYKA